MPRVARKDSQSSYYHIIVQGVEQKYIFGKNEYIEEYKRIILRKLEESNIKVLAYCIMGNHAHFLLYSEKCEYVSKYMQRVNTTYSQFHNRTNKRVGFVFRDRYYSQDILSKKQLHNCLKYIHNNPVKAGIVRNSGEYRYSSYNEFIKEKFIITDESIELLFGTKDYKEQFDLIHRMYDENEEDFLDIKEQDITQYIKTIEKKYKGRINELIKEKELLQKIIKEARKETCTTIEELARTLNLSKSTIWRYMK